MAKAFVYYSNTGNGDYVGTLLKNNNGYEIIKLRKKRHIGKPGLFSYLIYGFKAGIHAKSELEPFSFDSSKYEKIVLGCPIWNDNLACPMNTFLSKVDLSGRRLIWVLYSAGGSEKKASKWIEAHYPNSRIIDLKEPFHNSAKAIELMKYL